MATIRQTIDIDRSIDAASLSWSHFVKWVLVGHYRFVCDALTCARAIDSEVTSFQRLDAGHTRIVVEIDYDEPPGGDPEQRRAALQAHLQQDLRRFKEFTEMDETSDAATVGEFDETGRARKAHPEPPAETQHTLEDSGRPRFIALAPARPSGVVCGPPLPAHLACEPRAE